MPTSPAPWSKPIVMAAALEKGKITEDGHLLLRRFSEFRRGPAVSPRSNVRPIRTHTDPRDLGDVIANSCNDGMMQIAAAMGREQFIKSQSLFNFGTRTGIDLPNEGTGIIHTAATMGATELACSAFGQGFTCTMIQEINAMCSVINGGYYYQPHLVTRIKDSSGGVVKTYSPTLLKQTISANISADIRSYMELSLSAGNQPIHSKVDGLQLRRQDRNGREASPRQREISGILHRICACG